jgi:hypothetical protein
MKKGKFLLPLNMVSYRPAPDPVPTESRPSIGSCSASGGGRGRHLLLLQPPALSPGPPHGRLPRPSGRLLLSHQGKECC